MCDAPRMTVRTIQLTSHLKMKSGGSCGMILIVLKDFGSLYKMAVL